MKMRRIQLTACAMFAAFALACVASPASAQTCQSAIDSLNFGVIDLTAGTPYDTSGTVHVTCRGTPNTIVRVCQNIRQGSGGAAAGDNPRHLLDGANTLDYNIYQDAGHTTEWGSYSGTFNAVPIDVALNASGTGAASVPIYGRIFGGQQSAPAGSYISNFAGNEATITYGSASSSCAAIGAANETPTPLSVSTNSADNCTISTSALDFGNLADTTIPHSGTATLTAHCTLNTAYTVSLSSGLNGVSSPMQRKMQFGSNLLSYNLYKDAGHSQVWGETPGTNTLTGQNGTGGNQNITVFGLVQVQTTPPPGTYRDFVIVTVTY